MCKEIFLRQLRDRLTRLPENEIQRRLDYYSEMIDDMVEDGISEEEAVASLGSVDDIAEQVLQDAPLATLIKAKATPKKGWTPAAIIIAIVGSPVWIPLLLALLIVAVAVYVVIWVLIASLCAVVLSLGVTGVYLVCRAFTLFGDGISAVIFTVGSGLALCGLCLLAVLAARVAILWLIGLSKSIFHRMKRRLIRKEEQ